MSDQKAMEGPVAAEVGKLIARRSRLASELADVDRELGAVRRALGLGVGPGYLEEERECTLCHQAYRPTRKDQQVCSGCRERVPRRSVVQLQDRQARGEFIRERCKSYPDHVCDRMVVRKAGRRGPLRCPDCQLGHKRRMVRRALHRARGRMKPDAREETSQQSAAAASRGRIPPALISEVVPKFPPNREIREGDRPKVAPRAETDTAELEVVWSGAKEAAGEVPGLSRCSGRASSLAVGAPAVKGV